MIAREYSCSVIPSDRLRVWKAENQFGFRIGDSQNVFLVPDSVENLVAVLTGRDQIGPPAKGWRDVE